RTDVDGRAPIVEAIVNGLSPDARAFLGVTPTSLAACEADRAEFRDRFNTWRHDLVQEFERHRPSDGIYSPLSFFFNFSHNVLKGTVVDALLRGEPWTVSFNDLLSGITVRLKPDTADDRDEVRLKPDGIDDGAEVRLAADTAVSVVSGFSRTV